ncbi:MAG: hypothetical protein WC358_11100, partial [Ignavibacteria bacterium]
PLFIIIASIFIVESINAQGFTPPKMIFGISLDGNFATNDAHGTNFKNDPNVYGMIWGRGISLNSKFGLGIRKNHRITLGATYNKMVNIEDAMIPFFVFAPSDPNKPFTSFNIWTGALGYEYAFNPRCKSKQYLGFAFTGNYIVTTTGSYYDSFENSFRVGMQITTGYEFVLDKNFKTGLSIGLKYNLTNILGTTNGPNTFNDGAGTGGPTYWRRIGILSINLGFNFYTGVKPYRGVK